MPFDENIIQTGGEMSSGEIVGVTLTAAYGAPILIIMAVLLVLYNLDHIKKLQEACIEIIKKELKMQMRLCLTYDLKISKGSGPSWLRQPPWYHNHDFSKLFILNKIEKNYFFDKLNGEWNKGVKLETIFKDETIQKMLQNKKIELKKEAIIKYIVFDIFFLQYK